VIRYFDDAWRELTADGAGFAMTEIEVRGAPMRVFNSAPPTMRTVWELAQIHAAKPYIVFEDETYTYAETSAQVRLLAHQLRDAHGVGSGDRVAIAMRNYPEWVVSYWATVAVGAAVVGVNAWWTSQELAYGLGDSRPVVLIADDERLARVLPVLDELRSTAPLSIISVRSDRELPEHATRWADVVGPTSEGWAAAPETLPEATIDPDDDVTIFYTSGTTGSPKGAQITHRGSVHNILNIAFMTTAASLAEAKAIAAGELPAPTAPAAAQAPQHVFMAPTPLFHVTANNCILHPCTLIGGKIVFMHKWDTGRALELIERERVTNVSGVPTMSRELLLHPDWSKRDVSSLKLMGGGGAPLQPDLVDKIDKSLATGAPSTGYGLTETSGIVTANASRLYLAKPASCGRVVPTLDAKLVDELGEDVVADPDALGELCVRGAVVIKGYLNRPEATADAIRDGWFRTGDIARIDEDGFVFIVDRAKDMVLRGGENVYCSEVETAIYEHPDIAEAAVFGVPDERLGEDVAAAVVLRDGAALSAADLQAFLAERIAKYKIPATIWIRGEALPRNANGKFLKRELRSELLGA
jgi:long-chain acyl-CoA synthetase